MDRKEFGFMAENIAARYLLEKGYAILGRNYRKPWGEIDIIAEDSRGMVFVEVKANIRDFGSSFAPEVRVNPAKVSKIVKTAMLYLEYEHHDTSVPWRVDIVSVTLHEREKKAKIVQFKNIAEAFS